MDCRKLLLLCRLRYLRLVLPFLRYPQHAHLRTSGCLRQGLAKSLQRTRHLAHLLRCSHFHPLRLLSKDQRTELHVVLLRESCRLPALV